MAGIGEHNQADEGRCHAPRQGEGQWTLVRVEPDDRLQQRCSELECKGQQPDLHVAKIVVRLQQRIDGREQ